MKWFGYQLYQGVDAAAELLMVINLSIADIRQAWPLLEPVYDHPERLDRTEVLTADRGYDDTKIRSAGTSIRISPSSPSGTGGRIPMRHTAAATSAIVT